MLFKFKPAWWLPGPHLQTLWPAFRPRRIKNLLLRRERFALPDNDFIDLDWAGQGHGPIVLILHGLEGSSRSSYVQGILNSIVQRGWRGVVMLRGGNNGNLPRRYHSGHTGDVARVISALHQRELSTPIAAVGFSLGGNVLLKWLGEVGTGNSLVAAVAVSVPFDLQDSVKHIQSGFSRVYQRHLLNRIRRRLPEKISGMRTIEDFDEKITAPLYGFPSAQEYYTLSSSRQYLSRIHTPTLLLQAKDDPLIPEQALPTAAELSSSITFELMPFGGHLGFISGKVPLRPKYWLERRIPDFLSRFFES